MSSAEALIRGVGEIGCGLEAQLESMYRFLIQPDPWQNVAIDPQKLADLGTGVDFEVLAQRKAFLRPDSALVVVMITDEDDSAVDPLSVGGQGWAFMAKDFPGSNVRRGPSSQGTTAPRGTSACETAPGSDDCTSCGFFCDPSTPACQKLRLDPNCTASGKPGSTGQGYDGYFAATDDEFGVRFQHMKERYGIDPQFPIARYIDGLTRSVVPNRDGEHAVTSTTDGRREISSYAGTANCTNPIFAAELPSTKDNELCDLARGPRSRELVLFAVIGGVPEPLATETPEWTKILGQDPDNYNLAGIDPHMIQSVAPRAGLPAPEAEPTDPIHGREWNTGKRDLQYACTFALPTPRQCVLGGTSCDCGPDSEGSPPLCGTNPTEQVRGKAYPTHRPLRVVRGLGERGVVRSICAPSYDGMMTTLIQRLSPRLAR